MNMTKGSENPNKQKHKKLHNKLLYVTIFLGEKGGRWMKWQTGEEKVKQKQRRIIEQNVKKSKK